MRTFETVHAEPWSRLEVPRYRVHFWQRRSPEDAWNLNAHVLEDAQDVDEVLAWAGGWLACALGRLSPRRRIRVSQEVIGCHSRSD